MLRRCRHRGSGRAGLVRAVLVLLLALPASAGATEFLDPSHALHAWLADEVREGRMSSAEALLTALEAVFAPDELSADASRRAADPVRCATLLLHAVDEGTTELDRSALSRIRAWRAPTARRLPGDQYLSVGGRFAIEYWDSGTDSVDVTDLAPANGVPDYVERVAQALETSWSTEVDLLGFEAPATGGLPYEVQLRSIGSYGYVELDAAAPGGTRIVLRNSYAGLPPNDDPEGSAIGALRVSAAHEFRHAGQYATSGWSEPGLWVEVDATWMEEQVYGQVNDYVRFLASGSPISDPQLPLDQGGTASYPECVFQHWIQARLGVGAIKEFWDRRRQQPSEEVLDSYDAVLSAHWAPLGSVFVDFATFNLQTGMLAAPGTGYPDAALYPEARLSETAGPPPVSFGSAVEHLAARLYRIDGFSDGTEEVRLRVRQPDGVDLDLNAVALLDDGLRVVEPLESSAPDTTLVLATPARRIVELYLVVANGAKSGPVEWFFVDVEEAAPAPPAPEPVLADTWTTLELATDQTRSIRLDLQNAQTGGSTLDWTARAVEPLGATAARAIDGSTLSFDVLDYAPGQQRDYALGILNGSTGFEYLAGVTLTLPPGVTPVVAGDFDGSAGFDLVYDGFDGGTSEMRWIDPDGGFGAVPGAGTALASVRLDFADTLTGPLGFDWTIAGDGFGSGPHEVGGQATLTGPSEPRIEVLSQNPAPPALVGEVLPVQWFAAESGPVSIEVSRDDGQSWEVVTASTPNDGLWFWSVDGPTTTAARLRVNTASQNSPPSARFDILQPVPFAALEPAAGTLGARETTSLLLTVDATGIAPGDYPVVVDVRDAATAAQATLEILVQVRPSAVDAPAARRTRVIAVEPNPFNPATAIHFELARRSRVSAEILDLRGRRVRQLLGTTLPAGEHAARWDGTDAGGAAVASGTYVYRLRVEGRTFSGKLSLIR